MRTNQCGRVVLRLNIQADALARPAHVSCFRVQHDFNPVLSQDFANFFRDIGVLAGQKLARALNDRYSTAKAPEKLAELQADVASAQDQQVIRERFEFHDGDVVEKRHRVQPVDLRLRRARARIDENVLSRKYVLTAIVLGPLKLASPKINSRFEVFSMRAWLPFRKLSTMSRLR